MYVHITIMVLVFRTLSELMVVVMCSYPWRGEGRALCRYC